MVNSSDFTKRLEKILEFYSLSAAAFAEEIDFNRSTISHLLSGRNKPSLEFVMKLYQKFPDIDMDWLLFGKGSFPSNPLDKTEEIVKSKSVGTEKKAIDLFSNEIEAKKEEAVKSAGNQKEIDRIVIFFNDGTFNTYQN